MNKIRFCIALMISKVTTFLLQTCMKSPATSLPGKLVLKTFPDFLSCAKQYCKKDIITVTGTNGKTTTTGLLAGILQANDSGVVHNQKGANMPVGIVTAIANGVRCNKQVDYFVLESDEAYLSNLYDGFKADYLLVTNLFRDQLDRYGELSTTAQKIKSAVLKNPNLKVFLNADDPMLSELNVNKNTKFFGFEKVEYCSEFAESTSPAENVNCPCGGVYKYKKHFYSHLGHYFCACGFERPQPDYSANAKVYTDYTEVEVKNSSSGETHNFTIHIPNIYNAYNALAAVSLALEVNVPVEVIQKALNAYEPMFGRAERKEIDGKHILIQLIKNPTGATEVLRTVSAFNDNSNLFIAINDNYADGRDVSWLWDTDFEMLQNYSGKIFVSGIRAYDMATRLKYALVNMENVVIEPNVKKAIKLALDETKQAETLLMMPSYTVLLDMQKIL